jgi:hypothetical protein
VLYLHTSFLNLASRGTKKFVMFKRKLSSTVFNRGHGGSSRLINGRGFGELASGSIFVLGLDFEVYIELSRSLPVVAWNRVWHFLQHTKKLREEVAVQGEALNAFHLDQLDVALDSTIVIDTASGSENRGLEPRQVRWCLYYVCIMHCNAVVRMYAT